MRILSLGFLMCLSLLITSCDNDQNENLSTNFISQDGKYPVIKFEESEYDFGKITEGETVAHIFSFTNTGEGDLLISEARASCGCTVPEYPKDPIKPGEKGKITVKFNSKGKEGLQKKTVTVIANTKPINNELHFTADVQKQTDDNQ